jgi:tetratricopeptide (TPR) repeat protein
MEIDMANLTVSQKLFNELQIDLDTVPIEQLDTYTAVKYYLVLKDEPLSDVRNIDKVERYLHAFKDLCEISAWQQASQILTFRPASNDRELHDQLRIWGYYREQINLYNQLLGKVKPDLDLVCLCGLGRSFYNLSDFTKSFDYYQQQLNLARAVNNRQAEAQALDGLGSIQSRQFNYPEAIASYQQQLKIAREIGNHLQAGYALIGLAWALFRLGCTKGRNCDQQAGLEHLEEALEIAINLGDYEMESLSLNYISAIYFERGEHDQAMGYLMRQLDICDKTGDQRIRYFALDDLGQCYVMLKQYENALEYLQSALIIVCETGDRFSESRTLNNLGVLYCYELKQYQDAISCFEKALELMQKVDIKQQMGICAVNLVNCYASLKKKEKVNFYLKIAQSIAAETDSVETKGLITMAIANAYWNRNEIRYRLLGLALAVKGLMIIPPWQSANGRIALRHTITVLMTSAKTIPLSIIKAIRKFLSSFQLQKRNQEPT